MWSYRKKCCGKASSSSAAGRSGEKAEADAAEPMDESRLAGLSHTKVQLVPHVWKRFRARWGSDFGGSGNDDNKD
eukprot:11881544-Prorocentrum_lima.AAC.1